MYRPQNHDTAPRRSSAWRWRRAAAGRTATSARLPGRAPVHRALRLAQAGPAARRGRPATAGRGAGAATFLSTGGEIRAVVRTDRRQRGVSGRRPSPAGSRARRSSSSPARCARWTPGQRRPRPDPDARRHGMPLSGQLPSAGYSNRATPGSTRRPTSRRMNFALDLAANPSTASAYACVRYRAGAPTEAAPGRWRRALARGFGGGCPPRRETRPRACPRPGTVPVATRVLGLVLAGPRCRRGDHGSWTSLDACSSAGPGCAAVGIGFIPRRCSCARPRRGRRTTRAGPGCSCAAAATGSTCACLRRPGLPALAAASRSHGARSSTSTATSGCIPRWRRSCRSTATGGSLRPGGGSYGLTRSPLRRAGLHGDGHAGDKSTADGCWRLDLGPARSEVTQAVAFASQLPRVVPGLRAVLRDPEPRQLRPARPQLRSERRRSSRDLRGSETASGRNGPETFAAIRGSCARGAAGAAANGAAYPPGRWRVPAPAAQVIKGRLPTRCIFVKVPGAFDTAREHFPRTTSSRPHRPVPPRSTGPGRAHGRRRRAWSRPSSAAPPTSTARPVPTTVGALHDRSRRRRPGRSSRRTVPGLAKSHSTRSATSPSPRLPRRVRGGGAIGARNRHLGPVPRYTRRRSWRFAVTPLRRQAH